MPANSLRNVLDGLDQYSKWKVSFEIEPYSWAAFAKTDSESIKRLARFLDDKTPAARVELVSGAYGQCYGWNISGESNIRHLVYGARAIRQVFPSVRVDTYAVQEPCWTSCLPQLLTSLGYKRAVLKNSTCWGGYHAPTLDADLILWTGSDGTSIPTVPRYAGEGLIGPATDESSQPGNGFVERCAAAGIEHPSGTILQDMGWPGRPWRLGIAPQIASTMRHVTWREYVDTIAKPAAQKWQASQEDLRVGLAWGGSILQRIAQNARAAENLILQAEKIAVLANMKSGIPYPVDVIDSAWFDLMFCQHHDTWIVPYNRRRAGGTWASEAEERTARIRDGCRKVLEVVAGEAPGAATRPSDGPRFVRLWNTTGFSREEVATLELPPGDDPWHCRNDRDQPVVSQIASDADGKRSLLVQVDVPAMAYATYQLTPGAAAVPPKPVVPSATARQNPDGTFTVENDLHLLKIDPARGGRILSLIQKATARDFVDAKSARSFNEYRGYFGKEGRWLSSADAPATVSVEETGPLRATVQIDGQIGEYPFRTRISVTAKCARIDVRTSFDFPANAQPFQRGGNASGFRLGEPWPAGREVTRSDRRPMYDSAYKLQALFPAALEAPVLHKNAPFDVCRSRLDDTTFNSWSTIRHNVILDWVDLTDADGSGGIAVMSDHTTAYSLVPGEPLGLVCCYAGLGNWFDYTLGRRPEVAYALVAHAGDWERGGLWREQARWNEPLVATVVAARPPHDEARWSFVEVHDPNVQLTSLHQRDGHTLLRLFNASRSHTTASLTLSPLNGAIELVELDGRVVSEISKQPDRISLPMPPFAVRTLRLSRGPEVVR